MAFTCKQCSKSYQTPQALGGHVRTSHPVQESRAAPETFHPTQAPADDAYYFGYCPRCRVKNRSDDAPPLDVQMCGKCGYLYWLADGKPFERFPGPPPLTEALRHEKYRRLKAGEDAMMLGKDGKWVPRYPEETKRWEDSLPRAG